MIVIAIIGSLFYGLAKKENLNLWLWPILGVASYFLGQVIVGFILGIFAPEMLMNDGSVILISIISGALACGGLYLIMRQQIKKKKEELNQSELLDDNL